MRFLQKSHIAAKRVEDVQYACLFCAELGHTLHKSDATVFFSPGALLEHVARHPRPLPEVAGLTVIDGDHDVPDVHRNDYDLHLRYPPREHPVLDGSRLDVASGPGGMPTGIAKETARRMYGQRLLPNRVPALQVAAGARITGLRWPEEHRGEWCFGWHEGAFASIPFDIMRLEPPPPEEIRYDSRSLVTAKARWRFVVKDKEFGDWLKFDKGDTITNLACKLLLQDCNPL